MQAVRFGKMPIHLVIPLRVQATAKKFTFNNSNLTEEIQVSRRASDRGSYAKPLLVQALSSHLRV